MTTLNDLPELPPPGINGMADLADEGWDAYTADQLRAYGTACAKWQQERDAALIQAMDCAHRCGVGSELAGAILNQPEPTHE